MKDSISIFSHTISYLSVNLAAIASLIWVVAIAAGDKLTQAVWLAFVPWVGGGALALGLIPSSILFVQSHKPRDLRSIWMSGVAVLVVTAETAALPLF